MRPTVGIVLLPYYPIRNLILDTLVFYFIYVLIQLNILGGKKFVSICFCKGEISWRGEIERKLKQSSGCKTIHSFLISSITVCQTGGDGPPRDTQDIQVKLWGTHRENVLV
jgi:hypothetical protein